MSTTCFKTAWRGKITSLVAAYRVAEARRIVTANRPSILRVGFIEEIALNGWIRLPLSVYRKFRGGSQTFADLFAEILKH